MKKPAIFGTGLVALDLVYGSDAATPKSYAGGTCGNVLTILAYLGWDAYPVARLADDAAGTAVRTDLRRWGVRLDYISVGTSKPTPVIVERIRRDVRGAAYHTFSWRCPRCGARLPSYQAVRSSDMETSVDANLPPRVFFMDRVSRGAIDLAVKCATEGAVVVFEPSAVGEPRLFEQAIRTAHVLKYSEERMRTLGPWLSSDARIAAQCLEVETLGPGGLRYRLSGRSRQWEHLDAYPVEDVVDAAGAGDWCTAGLIDQLLRRGLPSLVNASREQVRNALKFGQALSAWNCGFEGARGGMYEVPRAKLSGSIKAIMHSAPVGRSRRAPHRRASDFVCSSCAHVEDLSSEGKRPA